ncbi:LacI family DNA-binding transcriptional regulator [Arthrobacter sp.]|uniref:LacI family DNA-binding transcriptional regulator n=1 Tax=Arthrobacter sp. TaxID=1667 RepID=UPI003A900195
MNSGHLGKATLLDVARAAGVSRSTAARALGGYGSVNPELQASVLRAAASLGYRTNTLARSVSLGKSNTIGVVVSDIENPYFARAVQGVALKAKELGYDVILASSGERVQDERDAIEVFLNKRVDGLIIAASSRPHTSHLLDVVRMGRPLVLLDRRPDDVPADWVGTDNYADACTMTQYLIDRGHRRIAFLAGTSKTPEELEAGTPLPISTIAEKVRGIRETARGAGIDYEFLPGAMTPDEVRSVVTAMLRRPARNRPTALIASYNRVALPAFLAIRAAGVRMPQDLSLVSLDDAEWMQVSDPPVTAVALPAVDLGAKAAEVLIQRAQGGSGTNGDFQLDSTFVPRGSVAPPAQ